jgi:chorismate dehydratase
MRDEVKKSTQQFSARQNKIRVGAVSYLNTKPLIYGFENGMMKEEIELTIDHPANIADALLSGKIDIGLVPVAILPQMKEYYFVGDYGIGADGAVESVCLFSEVPVSEIKSVLLDYQSKTSISLVQLLLKEYWKTEVQLIPANENFIESIKGSTAGVVIGDRTFAIKKNYPFVYDLGACWKLYTGLPFVFAAWVSNKPMGDDFVKRFNAANHFGLENLQTVIQNNRETGVDLKTYYTKSIQFKLSEQHLYGLQLFLKKIESSSLSSKWINLIPA